MIKNKFLNLIKKYSKDENYNLKCWNEIEKNYSSKFRFYHNLKHIEVMLMELEKVESEVKDLDSLIFSIYYHDIIYKATRSDNEEKSALLFQNRLSKFFDVKKSILQIEATKEHKYSKDEDTNILLDLDLIILGKSKDEYRKYIKNIRKEYKVYPDFIFKKGRKKVLIHMLSQKSIFKTNFFKLKYEKEARENLKTELKELSF